MPNSKFLDAQDDFTRCHSQMSSLLIALSADDHFKCLSHKVVSDNLWLIADRLDDMKRAYDDLVREAK